MSFFNFRLRVSNLALARTENPFRVLRLKLTDHAAKASGVVRARARFYSLNLKNHTAEEAV